MKWSKSTFKNVGKEITKLKAKLLGILNLPLNRVNWEEVKATKLEIAQLWKQEEITGPKDLARIKWIN